MRKIFDKEKLTIISTLVNFIYLYSLAKDAKEQHDNENQLDNE